VDAAPLPATHARTIPVESKNAPVIGSLVWNEVLRKFGLRSRKPTAHRIAVYTVYHIWLLPTPLLDGNEGSL